MLSKLGIWLSPNLKKDDIHRLRRIVKNQSLLQRVFRFTRLVAGFFCPKYAVTPSL